MTFFGGHVWTFLAPNIHRVEEVWRVGIFNKMNDTLGNGAQLYANSDGYLEISKF